MGVGWASSPGELAGGALEMLSFSEGLPLFQEAKDRSKAYLMVGVWKLMSARGSNCLPPGLGLKTSIVPEFAWPEYIARIFSTSACCLVLVSDLKSSPVVVLILAMLCILICASTAL